MSSLAQRIRAEPVAGVGVTGGCNRSARAALRCFDDDEDRHE